MAHHVKAPVLRRLNRLGREDNLRSNDCIKLQSAHMGERYCVAANQDIVAGTEQVFRLNWAANGRQNALASTDHSLFVGDLVEEVTDYLLQEMFRQFYPSVRSAKVHNLDISPEIFVLRQEASLDS